MPDEILVTRGAESALVLDVVRRAAGGEGCVLLVEGDAGTGKSVFVRGAVADALATVRSADAVVAYGYCYAETGRHNAFQPFTEIVRTLAPVPQPGTAGVIKDAFKKTLPDWLAAVPFVGPVLGAGAKTAALAAQNLAADPGSADFDDLTRSYLASIVGRTTRGLVVLVIEDAHWIDGASCELLLRLARELAGRRLLVLLTYRPGDLSHDDPFYQVRSELLIHGIGTLVTLEGFTEAQAAEYVRLRFGPELSPRLARWLVHLCRGHPLFMAQLLRLLEQERVIEGEPGSYRLNGDVVEQDGEWRPTGALAELPSSRDLDVLLDQRVHRLGQDERELLQRAAVQGQHFDTAVLSATVGGDELVILAQLRTVSERHRIVVLPPDDGDTAESGRYAFEHFLLQQAFYRRLSPRERVLYHRRVANALRPGATGPADTAVEAAGAIDRRQLLELARHHRLGHEPFEAARHYQAAAVSCYLDGAAAEAAQLCEEAETCLNDVPPTAAGRDALLATTVLIRLTATAFGPVDPRVNEALLAAAAAAEAAATRAKLPALRTRIHAAAGALYVRMGDVGQALARLREAVRLAEGSGDGATLFLTLALLGRELAKESLEESLAVRYRAREVFERLDLAAVPDTTERETLARHAATLSVYIGLGELDRGHLDATTRLEAGIAELRAYQMRAELLAGLNYLAQAYALGGRWSDAERALRESLALHPEWASQPPHPWVGYNLALLGKVYMEAGRYAEVDAVLRPGLAASEACRQMDLLTIVRNYQGEWLVHPGNAGASPDEAERVLLENARDAQAAGLHRSTTQALALLAVLELHRGRVSRAVDYGREALGYVERIGAMPALRLEEVYFVEYLVRRAAGDPARPAETMLRRAHELVGEKARRLQDRARRAAFLSEVPLNRRIRDAYAREGGRSAPPGPPPPDGPPMHGIAWDRS